jgi:hypothetical protein
MRVFLSRKMEDEQESGGNAIKDWVVSAKLVVALASSLIK